MKLLRLIGVASCVQLIVFVTIMCHEPTRKRIPALDRYHDHVIHQIVTHPVLHELYFEQRHLKHSISGGGQTFQTTLTRLSGQDWTDYKTKCGGIAYKVWFLVDPNTVTLYIRPAKRRHLKKGCAPIGMFTRKMRTDRLKKQIRQLSNEALPPQEIRDTAMRYLGRRKFNSIAEAFETVSPNAAGYTKYNTVYNTAVDFVRNMVAALNLPLGDDDETWVKGRMRVLAKGNDVTVDVIREAGKVDGPNRLGKLVDHIVEERGLAP